MSIVPKVNELKITTKNNKEQNKLKIMRYTYEEKHKTFTFGEISKYCNEVQDNFNKKKLEGYLKVYILTPHGFFSSGRVTFSKQKINIEGFFTGYEKEHDVTECPVCNSTVNEFWIDVVKTNGKGGRYNGNNCLWVCLSKAGIHTWKHPSLLRTFLKIKDNEPIDISYIPQIEKRINFGIHVRGDRCYKPTQKYLYNINILLANGHYRIDKSNIAHDGYYVKYNERQVIVFKDDVGYDGQKEFNMKDFDYDYNTINKIGFSKIRAIANYKANEEDKVNTLKEAYDWVINQFNLAKTYSQEKINFYKYGFISGMIRHLLLYKTRLLNIEMENIDQYEHEFLSDASRNSYFFKKDIKHEKEYKYDQKASFASVLTDNTFYIPMKKGELRITTQENFDKVKNGSYSYGIYRCIVEEGSKKFQYNAKNAYCHFELTIAHNEGLKITMIQNEKPNTILFSCKGENAKCIKSCRLFNDYVKWMYQLKTQHKDCKLFKYLLSAMGGALDEKYKNSYYYGENGFVLDDPDNEIFNDIEMTDKEGTTKLTTIITKANRIYKCNVARLYPFLLSKQRLMMYNKVLTKYYDCIVKFRTDGFTSTKKIDEFEHENGKIGAIIIDNKTT